VKGLKPGCLVFYRRPGKRIHHIAIHAADVPPLIQKPGQAPAPVGPVAFEAGGGGSKTTSPQEALRSSAGVRLTAGYISTTDLLKPKLHHSPLIIAHRAGGGHVIYLYFLENPC